jgi:hypothetical protein
LNPTDPTKKIGRFPAGSLFGKKTSAVQTPMARHKKIEWHGAVMFFPAFLLAFELYQYIASSQFTAIEGD